jgi:hypothetical protein
LQDHGTAGNGTFQDCILDLKACAIGKAKQRNIPKQALGDKATIFNGRVGHNLLKIKILEGMEVTISKPNWHRMVDKATGFKRSIFFKTKNH